MLRAINVALTALVVLSACSLGAGSQGSSAGSTSGTSSGGGTTGGATSGGTTGGDSSGIGRACTLQSDCAGIADGDAGCGATVVLDDGGELSVCCISDGSATINYGADCCGCFGLDAGISVCCAYQPGFGCI
jgi:hypothetical protein